MRSSPITSALIVAVTWLFNVAQAATLPLPSDDNSVVGEVKFVTAKFEDTLSDIGRRFGIGYEEMISANPGVDPWLPGAGTRVTIPTQYVLPDAPREGIVINLPEHRLYYFAQAQKGAVAKVVTYPISVGKMDWTTPLGLTRIVDKRKHPSWNPPESVRAEHEADGRPLPKIVPPGPDNPLGDYAMRLGIPGGAYLIHGTNKPIAVGMPVTHGCIRMFPEDIEEFFAMVPVNTRVRIMHQPLKMGWLGNVLYMEAHPPLEGQEDSDAVSLTNITRMLVAVTRDRAANIDWKLAENVFKTASGMPVAMTSSAPTQSAAVR
jgi:L,D-transpeptidase ErfK/SrfK